jgi:outer membrane receptor protein involved in Fe transport
MRGLFTASSSIAALITATAAQAQETAPTAPAAPVAPAATTGSTSYPASFFAQYSPRTALDIAQRVPGFQLQESNNDVRGFAGAAGNVVLNGARPSSKSESLETILAQIPAARVVRVEVGPGTLYGSDYAGRSQVLNIILSEVGGFDGTINATLGKQWTGPVNPNISASATIKRGQHGFNFSAGTDNEDRWDEGTDIITDPATGERFEKRRKLNHYRPRNPYVSAGWSLEQAADRSIHLNGRFQKFTEDFIQVNRVYPTGEEPRDDRLFMKLDSPGYELSGDITRPLAGGALKLVALTNRRHREGTDTVEVRDDGVAVDGFEQSTESQQNETLGKLSWTRSDLWGLSVEAGAEAALNTLDYHLDLFDITPGGKVRIDLPLDDAQVREKRAEFYIKAGKQFSSKLRVDAGLNYEMSDLKVSGDTQAERQLSFLKPSLTVDLKPGNDWHAQFIVRRTVAQLNFFDFISAAELSNDRVNGGNANLQPQRVWEFRATVDRPLLGTGLVKLDLGHDRIDMLQDRILICDPDDPTNPLKCLDAPGNLGGAKRTFASLTVDAPLDMLWKGLRAKLFGQVQRTSVEDPISGETRRFSNFFPEWQWELELRRDIGKWAYGTTLSDRDRFSFFRANEVDTNWNDGVFGSAFIEYRPSARTTVNLNVENIFDTRSMRQREFTFPNRGFPGPSLNEFRERNNHPIVTLGFKRTFGGAAAKPN